MLLELVARQIATSEQKTHKITANMPQVGYTN